MRMHVVSDLHVDIDGNAGRGTMIGFAKDNVQLYR